MVKFSTWKIDLLEFIISIQIRSHGSMKNNYKFHLYWFIIMIFYHWCPKAREIEMNLLANQISFYLMNGRIFSISFVYSGVKPIGERNYHSLRRKLGMKLKELKYLPSTKIPLSSRISWHRTPMLKRHEKSIVNNSYSLVNVHYHNKQIFFLMA